MHLILRDAAKAPLLPSERKCAHPGMRESNLNLRESVMPKAPPLRLGVNVDHVATLRNASGP
jgi:hypothetical protein